MPGRASIPTVLVIRPLKETLFSKTRFCIVFLFHFNVERSSYCILFQNKYQFPNEAKFIVIELVAPADSLLLTARKRTPLVGVNKGTVY